MNRILASLSRCGWNKRILMQTDFDRWCRKSGVKVIDCEMKWDGFYRVCDGHSVIVLNEKLRGADRQYVQWHELAHHLLHTPETRFFLRGTLDKAEYQAHLIAACALMPVSLLAWTDDELLDDLGYRPQIVRFRRRIWEERGI